MAVSDRVIRKLPEAGRNAANALSAHTLTVARPLFWHIGVRNSAIPKGASAFILQFERQYVGVTADHVIATYLADLATDSRTVCQLGTCQIWPEKSTIARSAKLDIATFAVEAKMLEAMGAYPIDCRREWPPPDVQVGDTLTLTGFLDNHRTRRAPNRYDMEAWGAHAVADAVSEREIVTAYDPNEVLSPNRAVAKPPLGFNMIGCSGGPALLIKEVRRLLRWFPVGFIYKGPDGKAEGEFSAYDRIHIRRIHFLRTDGTINAPESGWLPA